MMATYVLDGAILNAILEPALLSVGCSLQMETGIFQVHLLFFLS